MACTELVDPLAHPSLTQQMLTWRSLWQACSACHRLSGHKPRPLLLVAHLYGAQSRSVLRRVLAARDCHGRRQSRAWSGWVGVGCNFTGGPASSGDAALRREGAGGLLGSMLKPLAGSLVGWGVGLDCQLGFLCLCWDVVSPDVLLTRITFSCLLETSSSSLQVAAYVFITVGAVTMLMGFLGCIGAVNEVRCLLGLVSPDPSLCQAGLRTMVVQRRAGERLPSPGGEDGHLAGCS